MRSSILTSSLMLITSSINGGVIIADAFSIIQTPNNNDLIKNDPVNSIDSPARNNDFSVSRRQWMFSTVASGLGLVSTVLVSPTKVVAAEPIVSKAPVPMTSFDDPKHGFSIDVPSSWVKSVQTLFDRRELVLFTDPTDPKTALFIAYTPVRDDFTSLSSFGNVDQVAQQTILPKGQMAGVDVESEMLKAITSKQAYIFDYIQSVPNVQPTTHFRTVFSLAQGATGGAGAVLVTITAQTPEERYVQGNLKSVFDAIIDSYGKNKA